jgi:DNA-binding SARP family transcriptional activator
MTQAQAAPTSPGATGSRTVHLFGGPYVTCEGRVLAVPQGSKKLLAFLALRRGRVERSHVAGTLWPSGGDARAQGNLRSSLWRLRRAGIDVVVADKWSMSPSDDVEVDSAQLSAWAERVLHGGAEGDDLGIVALPPDALELLPGWYDDWVVIERERTRQRLMHALEALSRLLVDGGRFDDAVEVGLAAVAAEPLRESAQRALIEALLAQSNPAEARRAFVEFRDLLARELGIEPSPQLVTLLAADGQSVFEPEPDLTPMVASR